MTFKYLFGPVPSRRLGVSLGVDLVPFKTCSLDCVYCECGRTTRLTADRKDYVPVQDVIDELGQYLDSGPELDHITFSGSGEPTLHSGIGMVIRHIKEKHPDFRVAVLTNGTLLMHEDVRRALYMADVVIPSLDAASETVFKKLNRPHESLLCRDAIAGLADFSREYRGELRLEVFIVPCLNDTEEEMEKIRKAISAIRPGSVELNTLDRPGPEKWVRAASPEELKKIASYLGDGRIIGRFEPTRNSGSPGAGGSDKVLAMLARRPCTVADLSYMLGLRPAEVNKLVRMLLLQGEIESELQARGEFLKLKKTAGKLS